MSYETAFVALISLAAGFALGCIYVLLRIRKDRDRTDMQIQSLKQTAGDMMDSGSLTGLDPHKVYQFCSEYEKMAAENKKCRADVRDMCADVSFILTNCDHEPSPDDYAEDIYLVPAYMLFDIIETKK